jgi:hypothetical protein
MKGEGTFETNIRRHGRVITHPVIMAFSGGWEEQVNSGIFESCGF